MTFFGGVISVTGISYLIFSLFAVILLGYILGAVKIKGVSFGAAGVFITALLYGCLFYDTLKAQLFTGAAENVYASDALKLIENIGLLFFVTSVGFMAGPNFFSNLRRHFKSYVLVALVIVLSGGLCCALCILIGRNLTDLDNSRFGAIIVGLMSGSLTSTPSFSAAKATAANIDPSLEELITVGHGISYLFGVMGKVLFVQLVPKLMKADMEKERELLKQDIASVQNEEKAARELKKTDKAGFIPFSFAAAVGLFIGAVKIGNFSLTTAGGCLLVSLIAGHFGRIGRLSIMPDKDALKTLRELGLVLFLAGAGIAGGASFVRYFKPVYFVYGIVMTVIPMILGFIFAKYVLKLRLLNNLGSVCGGMTSTPALGMLISTSGTEDVTSAYAASYPAALVTVVIVSEILILIFC